MWAFEGSSPQSAPIDDVRAGAYRARLRLRSDTPAEATLTFGSCTTSVNLTRQWQTIACVALATGDTSTSWSLRLSASPSDALIRIDDVRVDRLFEPRLAPGGAVAIDQRAGDSARPAMIAYRSVTCEGACPNGIRRLRVVVDSPNAWSGSPDGLVALEQLVVVGE
jgi:hypothetical protein